MRYMEIAPFNSLVWGSLMLAPISYLHVTERKYVSSKCLEILSQIASEAIWEVLSPLVCNGWLCVCKVTEEPVYNGCHGISNLAVTCSYSSRLFLCALASCNQAVERIKGSLLMMVPVPVHFDQIWMLANNTAHKCIVVAYSQASPILFFSSCFSVIHGSEMLPKNKTGEVWALILLVKNYIQLYVHIC